MDLIKDIQRYSDIYSTLFPFVTISVNLTGKHLHSHLLPHRYILYRLKSNPHFLQFYRVKKSDVD
jgi:hypothetical protein